MLYIVETTSGAIATVADINAEAVAWSPDSLELAYAGENGRIQIVDAATGRGRVLSAEAPISGLAFSPDGRTLAFISAGRPSVLVLVPLVGGPARLLGRDLDRLTPAWSPDGSELIVAPDTIGQTFGELQAINASSGAARTIIRQSTLSGFPTFASTSFSRDGTRVLFTGGEVRTDAWTASADGSGAPQRSTSFFNLDARQVNTLSSVPGPALPATPSILGRQWMAPKSTLLRLAGEVPYLAAEGTLVAANVSNFVSASPWGQGLYSWRPGERLRLRSLARVEGRPAISKGVVGWVEQTKAADRVLRLLRPGQVTAGTVRFPLLANRHEPSPVTLAGAAGSFFATTLDTDKDPNGEHAASFDLWTISAARATHLPGRGRVLAAGARYAAVLRGSALALVSSKGALLRRLKPHLPIRDVFAYPGRIVVVFDDRVEVRRSDTLGLVWSFGLPKRSRVLAAGAGQVLYASGADLVLSGPARQDGPSHLFAAGQQTIPTAALTSEGLFLAWKNETSGRGMRLGFLSRERFDAFAG